MIMKYLVNQKTNIFLIDPPLFSLQKGKYWNLFSDLQDVIDKKVF